MKVYYGRNKEGRWKASLDEKKIEKFSNKSSTEVKEINNNKIWMITVYFGWDYRNGGNGIGDIMRHSKPYHSVTECRKSSLWQDAIEKVNSRPYNFVTSDFMIASKDFDGDPFNFGHVSENKFNMKIIPVKVI